MSSVENGRDLDVRIGRQDLARHRHALVRGEERALRLAVGDPDDDAVEQARRPAHDVFVSAGQRVERAWVDDLEHGFTPPVPTGRKDDNAPAPPCRDARRRGREAVSPARRPRRRCNPPAQAARAPPEAASAHGSSRKGGSAKITSNSRRSACRYARASPVNVSIDRAPNCAAVDFSASTRIRFASTATASAAPRDAASSDSAPEPA